MARIKYKKNGEWVAVSDRAAIVDVVYPPGTLYFRFDDTNPSELFGGEWEQLTGRFLRMDDNTNMGGEDYHTLTVNEIPSHNHAFNQSYSITTGSIAQSFVLSNLGTSLNLTVGNTGGGQAHNNMPKYQNVYAWKRIA